MTQQTAGVILILDSLFRAGPFGISVLAMLVAWTIVWKGIALWKAARNGSKPWFVVLLVVNTVGILEIIYIFFFSKKKDKPVA